MTADERPKPGDRVRVVEGPFLGMEGTVRPAAVVADQIPVTLTIFGRPVHVDLEAADLRPFSVARVAQWPAGTPVFRMLRDVEVTGTPRQRRLFAVACCRRLSGLMSEDRCRPLLALTRQSQVGVPPETRPDVLLRTVDAAERCADGEGTPEDLEPLSAIAYTLFCQRAIYYARRNADDGAVDVDLLLAADAAGVVQQTSLPALVLLRVTRAACEAAHLARTRVDDPSASPLDVDECDAQADLVRDIFGRPLHLDEPSPHWSTPDVAGLARAIYDERSYRLLPVLADALEDGGEADAALLAHLRSPGPHVRGCWALDLVLGKG